MQFVGTRSQSELFENGLEVEGAHIKDGIHATNRRLQLIRKCNAKDIKPWADPFDISDVHSINSVSKFSNLYSSASSVSNMSPGKSILGRECGPDVDEEDRHDGFRPRKVADLRAEPEAEWVSPVDANKRRWSAAKSRKMFGNEGENENPFGKCPDSSFELNSSVVSLDFGLISPKRNWSSPPQRIERAQNREWSPHRVIDRPNPENSPGNWISLKESRQVHHHYNRQTLQQSPPIHDAKNVPVQSYGQCQSEEPRSSSQITYTVPEKISVTVPPRVEDQPTRKRSVLMDYVPDRRGGGDGVQSKKRSASTADLIPGSFPVADKDKVKRVVEPGGRIVKISLLDDYQVQTFGKGIEKNADDLDKNVAGEPPPKMKKSSLKWKEDPKSKALKSKTGKLITSPGNDKKVESGSNEGKLRTGANEKALEKKEEKTSKGDENHPKESKCLNDFAIDTKQIISDLEVILKDKHIERNDEERTKDAEPKSKQSDPTKAAVGIEAVAFQERKKRNIDTKRVHEYIKTQKQKRVEMMKADKKTKIEEREAIKKNLEELRARTLKLAAQSKKKKPAKKTIKVVDAGTEDDVTMSLGLKQVKPKVSYNESVLNLKKRTPRVDPQPMKPESREDSDHSVREEEKAALETEEARVALNDRKEATGRQVRQDAESTSAIVEKHNDLNAMLKKLAEALNMRMSEKEPQRRSGPKSFKSKSVKDTSTGMTRDEGVKANVAAPQEKRQMIAIDFDTIHALKEDIKKISDNFKLLHEIIVEKTDLSEAKGKNKAGNENSAKEEKKSLEKVETQSVADARSESVFSFQFNDDSVPQWMQKMLPKPHPYSVYTAFRRKMNLETSKSSVSLTSQESSSYADTTSNTVSKYDSEPLSFPSDRLQPTINQIVQRISCKSSKTTFDNAQEKYFSVKDSGSEFSSSILDSEKQAIPPDDGYRDPLSVHVSASGKNSQIRSSKSSISVSSAITELTPKNLEMPSLKDSFKSKISPVNLDKDRENLSLVRPDVKLITNDLSEKKLNNHNQSVSGPVNSASSKTSTIEFNVKEGLNNSEEKSNREPKSDSTITEIIDNLSENDKSHCVVKTTNKKFQNAVQRLEETQQIRRTYFQPEMLHLQFQAELTLLETFQQSLSHFLEAERLKTLSEVSKIVYEKSVNTEKATEREDQAVQTSFVREDSKKEMGVPVWSKSETESVKTEIEMSESEDSVKSVKTVPIGGNDVEKDEEEKLSENKTSEIQESYSFEEDTESREEKKSCRGKSSATPELSNGHNGISFQMLDRMIKDEELRSEHQLALIRLREKTLNEKVKAELTFLEMKKRALKESGNDEEQSVSALKKKQRGILIKYQGEKEEIQRLKKMHKIASEERKIMIEQQKQIQQMQISTKDMLIKLQRKNVSPQKKNPLKPKVLKSDDSQEEIQEDIAIQMSDSIPTESVGSVNDSSRHSLESDLEISSECNGSDRESFIIQGSNKAATIQGKSKKAIVMEPEKYPMKCHSIDELLVWSKKLEEKENELKELERKTVNSMAAVKNRVAKPLKSVKIAVKDRSTSPFQFPEALVSPPEKSSSMNEIIETKISSSISEDVPKPIYKMEISQKVDKIPSSITEDIPAQFSKSNSRTLDYYSESFESPSSSEAPKTKAIAMRSKDSLRSKGSCKSIPIKLSLTSMIQSPRSRNSSGSDDSQNFSHTETTSEQSDLETRIAALHEQLRKRKLEAERLRREQKKAQRERLKVKEQSLLKQIQAYDAYIQKKKQELEQEYESSWKTVSKPLIKQPKVAEKSSLKKQEPSPLTESDKLKFYPKTTTKTKEKDESTSSLKITHESDSEIQEQIKEPSETEKTTVSSEKSCSREMSITEQIECKVRKDEDEDIEENIDGEKSKNLNESKEPGSSVEADLSLNEILETVKESTVSTESMPEPEMGDDKSASDSEDRSTSIKTMVHSPEKEDTDIISSKEKSEVLDEDVKETKPLSDNTYLSDSFESDFEEKTSTKGIKTEKESEITEVVTDISGDVSRITKSEGEKMKDETKTEEIKNSGEPEERSGTEERMKEFEEMTENESSSIKSIVSEGVSQPTETDGSKMANVEVITDSIIFDLLSESLKLFSEREVRVQKKCKEKLESGREALATILANKIIAETIDDVLKVYNRKTGERVKEAIQQVGVEEEPISPDKITSDIRKRICDIISHAGGIKEQKRPQEIMVTTYDVTPRTSPPEGDETEVEKREEFIRSLTSTPKKSNTAEVFTQSEPVHQDNKNDAFGQEWFDDDFGLSRTRREAEQLRLQQLQIEQEIQQLQAQQEQIPYYYIREIPNKPPPPYTPPGKSYSEIPTSESDVDKMTSLAVEILTAELNKGRCLRDVEPPREYFGEKPTSEHVKTYKTFLFDLAKHLILEVVTVQDRGREKVLPWNKVREPLSAYRYSSIERTTKDLGEYVRKRVLGLFGFRAKVGRESLMMRCFKKKRDHVDEILVFEAQEEEAQWTRFDEDQVAVKNEVALAILDDLLLESARLVSFIFNKKIKRLE